MRISQKTTSLNMGYLIFTIFFSMWELFCYVFYLYAQHNVLSYRLSYALPVGGGGGDKSMRSLPPPPGNIFFVIWRIFLLFFLHVGAFSYVYLFMHIIIRVGVTDYVVPPPPPAGKTYEKGLHME